MMKYKLSQADFQRILAFKRDIHMHPELSLKEFRTTEKIREFLESIPSCQILPFPAETGLVARIEGNANGPEVMLRADIDALPQTEQYESPWKSQTPGLMHACGHDFHTAALLGAALILDRAKEQGELAGCVDLVFQPAEEITAGARMLIDKGLFEMIHPDFCLGLHNWPSLPGGTIACHEGALMAAKRNFEIRIYGEGGHGSMPHLNIDPIVCAAAVVQSLQTVVSRNMNPLDAVVLSINMINGGSATNLVVDQVVMRGTVRSLSEQALDHAIERADAITEKTAQAYECRCQILWDEKIPAVYNSPEMTSQARKFAGMTGYEVIDAVPSLASEDYAMYQSYAPSFFYWVGSRAKEESQIEELHRPHFHTDDTALAGAAQVLAISAIGVSKI